MLTWTSGNSDEVFQNFTWIYIVIHCLEDMSNRKKSTEFYRSILIWQALQRLHLQNICLWTCFWFAMVVINITIGSLTVKLIFFFLQTWCSVVTSLQSQKCTWSSLLSVNTHWVMNACGASLTEARQQFYCVFVFVFLFMESELNWSSFPL